MFRRKLTEKCHQTLKRNHAKSESHGNWLNSIE